jgi:hypothetical protein
MEYLPGFYSPKFYKLPVEGNVYLQGYLQSWKYFEHVKQELKEKHFKFKPYYENQAKIFIENVRNKLKKEVYKILVNKNLVNIPYKSEHCQNLIFYPF